MLIIKMKVEKYLCLVLILSAFAVGIIVGMLIQLIQQAVVTEHLENMIEILNIEEFNINFNETRFADRLDETFRIVFNESEGERRLKWK